MSATDAILAVRWRPWHHSADARHIQILQSGIVGSQSPLAVAGGGDDALSDGREDRDGLCQGSKRVRDAAEKRSRGYRAITTLVGDDDRPAGAGDRAGRISAQDDGAGEGVNSPFLKFRIFRAPVFGISVWDSFSVGPHLPFF